MKVQLCRFIRNRKSAIENGLAFVKEFGLADVHFIIDEHGKKVNKVWTYKLIDGLGSHITTDPAVRGYS